MVKISRGNVVLDVNEDFLQTYLNQGYDVVDDEGSVIKRGNPNDVHSLKIALTDAHKEIDNLTAKVKELQALVDTLNKAKKVTTKSK